MFLPDKFYFSLLNKETVQGSILSRHQADEKNWYLVISQNPLVLFIPKLEKNLEIPSDRDPLSFIKMEVNKHLIFTGKVKKAKKRTNNKPSKRKNYAAQVVERGY